MRPAALMRGARPKAMSLALSGGRTPAAAVQAWLPRGGRRGPGGRGVGDVGRRVGPGLAGGGGGDGEAAPPGGVVARGRAAPMPAPAGTAEAEPRLWHAGEQEGVVVALLAGGEQRLCL